MNAQMKAIIGSIVVIALCLAAVGGVTYSWFSDVEESDISVSTARVDIKSELLTNDNLKGGSYGYEPVSAQDSKINFPMGGVADFTSYTTTQTVNVTNMVPGDWIQFDIKVTNNSTVLTKYAVSYNTADIFNVTEVAYSGSYEAWGVFSNEIPSTVTDLGTYTIKAEMNTGTGNDAQERMFDIAILVTAYQFNTPSDALPDLNLEVEEESEIVSTNVSTPGSLEATVSVTPSAGTNSTTVSVTSDTSTLPAGDYKVGVIVSDSAVASKEFTVNDGTFAVAAIDINLFDSSNNKISVLNGTATITTYIATGFVAEELSIYYDGEEMSGSIQSYDSTTGKLVFTTPHFSKFFIAVAGAVYDNLTNKTYLTFEEALESATNGSELVLLKDVASAQVLKDMGSDEVLTIDLNNKKISGTVNGSNNSGWVLRLKGLDAELNKRPTVNIKNGTITATNESGYTGYVGAIKPFGIILNLDKVSVIANSTATFESTIPDGFGVGCIEGTSRAYAEGPVNFSEITANDCNFSADGQLNYKGENYGYYHNSALMASYGTQMNLNNCTVNTNGYAVNAFISQGSIFINGGEYTGGKASLIAFREGSYSLVQEASVIYAHSGMFTGDLKTKVISGDYDAKLVIDGGTFGTDPSTYLAEGYIAKHTGDKWVVIKAPVKYTQGGQEKYSDSFVTAIKSADSNTTVYVLDDISEEYSTVLDNEVKSGVTIESADNAKYKVVITSQGQAASSYTINAKGSITIRNLSLEFNYTGVSSRSVALYGSADFENVDITTDNSKILVEYISTNNSDITFRECRFIADDCPWCGMYIRGSGNLTVDQCYYSGMPTEILIGETGLLNSATITNNTFILDEKNVANVSTYPADWTGYCNAIALYSYQVHYPETLTIAGNTFKKVDGYDGAIFSLTDCTSYVGQYKTSDLLEGVVNHFVTNNQNIDSGLVYVYHKVGEEGWTAVPVQN